ncbi:MULTISPECIES: alpha/beta fold hydrolase [Rhizobium]|uniref:Alpha/beta fold hydrolase n=1 Tax=Rhizobium fabae TaxID=573179 RepID=A0A7W6BB90_9HYPH|nr:MULTISPECIES: alpha/beta fold hydrolase [Rhizobium]MBB3914581.1 pimeloyl-ACP methyl ester carboxylesterase [Rhizobium fabae]PDS66205.1 alpha/beta hydrolase [Rhizobium anhuiense]RUM14507.1 alpha/beta fold hydrolase [Rhizobium fabae]
MDHYNELMARVVEAIKDGELPRLIPSLDCRVRLTVGDQKATLSIRNGEVALDGDAAQADVTVSASPEAWSRVLQTPPPATYHSFTALQMANEEFEISGLPLEIARARPALERLFELVVRAPTKEAAIVRRDITTVLGRYQPVSIEGTVYDIYFEETGTGVPVLFLHTAGADSRQFLAQLADTGLAESYRLMAVDLPFHGRSMPPASWDGAPYKLTADLYQAWCRAILERVVGEKAIVAGGSMGAAMALVLAAESPEHLLGIIGIEPPFRSKGRRNPYQHNVNVHGSLHNSAYVRGIMSPMSPGSERRRASWIYSQGAPGIYPGDLAFYSDEFDGAVTAPKIDASRTPTVLLSGDYDYSATPADGAKLADLIPGSLHLTMPGLGHFPMCEHPDYFRPYLMRALEFIRAAR